MIKREREIWNVHCLCVRDAVHITWRWDVSVVFNVLAMEAARDSTDRPCHSNTLNSNSSEPS